MNRLRNRVATIIIALMIFGLVAVLVQLGLADDFDRQMLLSLRDGNDINNPLGPVWLEEALAEITALGGYTVLSLVTLAAITCLLIARKFRESVILLAALAGGSVLSSLLKLTFSRPRPDVVVHLDTIFTSSFPSAHAMVSMFTWLLLAGVVSNQIHSPNQRRVAMTMAVMLSLLIGTSRVYLGVHWPTDVLAGWCMGIVWACLCGLAWQQLIPAREPIG